MTYNASSSWQIANVNRTNPAVLKGLNALAGTTSYYRIYVPGSGSCTVKIERQQVQYIYPGTVSIVKGRDYGLRTSTAGIYLIRTSDGSNFTFGKNTYASNTAFKCVNTGTSQHYKLRVPGSGSCTVYITQISTVAYENMENEMYSDVVYTFKPSATATYTFTCAGSSFTVNGKSGTSPFSIDLTGNVSINVVVNGANRAPSDYEPALVQKKKVTINGKAATQYLAPFLELGLAKGRAFSVKIPKNGRYAIVIKEFTYPFTEISNTVFGSTKLSSGRSTMTLNAGTYTVTIPKTGIEGNGVTNSTHARVSVQEFVELNDLTWVKPGHMKKADSNVSIYFNGITGDAKTRVIEAANDWNAQTTFNFSPNGTSSQYDLIAQWATSWASNDSSLGLTSPPSIVNGKWKCTLEFNPLKDHPTLKWNYNAANDTSKVHFQSTALHELGHVIGLKDIYEAVHENSTLMYYAQRVGFTRAITARDKNNANNYLAGRSLSEDLAVDMALKQNVQETSFLYDVEPTKDNVIVKSFNNVLFSEEELTQLSNIVVAGTVVDIIPGYYETIGADGSKVYFSAVVVDVKDSIKGNQSNKVAFPMFGGYDGESLHVYENALTYAVGESYIFFSLGKEIPYGFNGSGNDRLKEDTVPFLGVDASYVVDLTEMLDNGDRDLMENHAAAEAIARIRSHVK